MLMLALIALTPIAYNIPSRPAPYKVEVHFNGYIPILGGMQGKVDLNVGITVKSADPDNGNPRAVTDLTDLKIILNDATLPFGKDEVEKYFPNTVTMTPQGKVLKNDAPDLNLPVQLPGLDIKRFPDITFLPVEFPADGIEQGKPFSYSREFGNSAVNYTVTPTSIDDNQVSLDLKLNQDYTNQEDDARNVAKDPKDAVAEVKTHMQGTGKVVFDRHLGLVKSMHLDADAASVVTDLKTKATSSRDLKTSEDVALIH